jgi:hypothetical protein
LMAPALRLMIRASREIKTLAISLKGFRQPNPQPLPLREG